MIDLERYGVKEGEVLGRLELLNVVEMLDGMRIQRDVLDFKLRSFLLIRKFFWWSGMGRSFV